MKWVVIVKYSDNRKSLVTCDDFNSALDELDSMNHDCNHFNLVEPIKVTIEKMVMLE